jgi:hypoxia up-regulated 1
MLGKGPLCPIQQWYKDHYYPYVMEEAADGRGGSQVSVPGGGGFDALNYTAEALVGQILAHARELAEATAEETVKESVITVPPFWGQDQRQAILGERAPL